MEQSQKNNKDFLYVISLLLVAIVLMCLGFMYWENDNTLGNKKSLATNKKILTEDDIAELMDDSYEATTTDQLVFNVMQNTDGPNISKVIIAPQKVSRGEEQYLEVWINDEQGVQSVQTETELDGGFIKKLDMELFEGDMKNGKWRVTWVVHDTHDKTYNTKFIATSIDNRESDVVFGWLDPCSPPLTGDWIVNTTQTCDEGGLVGTEGGNVILDGSVTFINTSLVFNPGKSIALLDGGQIILCATCRIEKAYMVIRDPDADGQFAQGASQNLITATTTNLEVRNVNGVNRQGKWINGVWYTYALNFQNITNSSIPMGGDCYETDTDGGRNTFSGQTQFFTEPTGRGGTIEEWDYDCNGIKQFGNEYWGTCIGGVIEFEENKHWTDYYGGCQTNNGGWFYCEKIDYERECGRPSNPAMHIWFNNPICGPEAYLLVGNALETSYVSCK